MKKVIPCRTNLMAVEIHGTSYSKLEIGALSYNEVYQMLGACTTVKDFNFICNAWNRANPNALKELE